MTSVVALVVLYQTSVDHSTSLQCLSEQNTKNFKLLVWDNSNVPLSPRELEKLHLKFESVVYKSTPDNLGLAAIFNAVLSEYTQYVDILITFDQDSKFANNYIQLVINTYKINPAMLYVPLIFHGTKYHSPRPDFPGVRRFWYPQANRMLSSIWRLNSINSGNAFNVSAFRSLNFKFDEKLRFYGVDNYLFRYLYKNKIDIFVLNSVLKQSFSIFEIEDNITLYKKYNDVIDAYKQVYFPKGVNLWTFFAALHIFRLSFIKRDKVFLKLLRRLLSTSSI
jgi:hypothetical protein